MNTSPWFKDIQAKALKTFEQEKFPTLKNEAFKYTNLALLQQQTWAKSNVTVDSTEIKKLISPLTGFKLVFIDGIFNQSFSDTAHEKLQFDFSPLAEILKNENSFFKKTLEKKYSSSLEALNLASVIDGLFIKIRKNEKISLPIQIIFISNSPRDIHLRNIIHLEQNSEAHIYENHLSTKNSLISWHNTVTQIIAEESSRLHHFKIQNQSSDSFHTAHTHIHQNRDSFVKNYNLAFGARLSRNEIYVDLEAEGSECDLKGLSAGHAYQHIDQHVHINHNHSRTKSHELFKGVLNGQARGVFTGRIHVKKDAQHIDAQQTNKNLLLSEKALVDVRPQLEIYADDVKCTHGAAIGRLDDNALFYLRSRGIDLQKARSILTQGFVDEIVDEFRSPGLKDYIEVQLARVLE